MSAEASSKVGCPRCGNFLAITNITDYSVYLCGACDAVLRAKRSTLQLEVLSDAEMFGIGGGMSERSSLKSQETNTKGMMAKRMNTRFGTNANSSSYAARYENYTQDFVGNAVVGLQRVGETRDWNRRERPSTSYYLEEDNSSKGNYGFGDSMDQFDDIGYIVDDRAELLRKLDELREQVNRTCDIADKSKDKYLVDKHTARTPYMTDHYAMDANNSQQLRQGLHQPYAPFEHMPFRTRFSGSYMDRNRVHTDSFESYLPNIYRHHALSSSSSRNSRSKLPIIPYGDEEAYYDHRRSVNELQGHASLLSFPDESYRSKSPRVLTANRGHICQPIAGGAPFLTCQNCFGLLLLPKKVFFRNENQKKVICGACSITIVVVVDRNGLDFSVHAEGNQTYQNNDEGPSKRFRAKMSFSYEDFDNSGSDFLQRDRELGDSRSTSQVSSRKSSEARSNHSTYSSSSSSDKAQNVQTSPAKEKESIIATEMAVKGKTTPPPPAGSSLQQYFDYSDKFRVMKHTDKSPRQSGLSIGNSMKDGSATEIDISSNEFSNAGTSLNSGEAIKEGLDKVAEHMKNSFKDMNVSKNDVIISQAKVDVTINGKAMPDFLIKKAEKIAGPINPGHYWYDFRAGFWGVIDGPCLGIIPPFIEEFNYPMPENCTGGKTGVFVNGRELHEKDLKLLSRRGLPTERDRFYIVEISGRVLDENTGKELERLGKLAPTVERSNHGFGMRGPKPAA